jgi:hypothetical protein
LSPLTKALVLIVTILAVVLVALIVPFAAKVDNWKERYQQETSARAAAEQKASLTQNDIQAMAAANQRQTTQLNQQLASLQQQVLTLTSARQQAEVSLIEARSARERAEADMRALTASSERATSLATKLTEQTQQLQDRLVTQQTRNIELADRNAALMSETATLTRQVRRLRETMLAMEDQNRQLTTRLAQAGISDRDLASQTPVLPSADISGQIMRVDNVADTTLVLVNLGTRDGVSENMKFMVYRGDEFVGNLLIETVDVDNAAGRIVLKARNVQVGDGIRSASF